MIFWAVSRARVVMGLVRHQTFGAEGTLAFLAVLVVPTPSLQLRAKGAPLPSVEEGPEPTATVQAKSCSLTVS